jgi:hypothetical protein
MSHELVILFFKASDKQSWVPVPREEIPEWLRNETVIDRLVAGECIRNVEAENRTGMMWWTALAIDRKQISKGQIILPERVIQMI